MHETGSNKNNHANCYNFGCATWQRLKKGLFFVNIFLQPQNVCGKKPSAKLWTLQNLCLVDTTATLSKSGYPTKTLH